MAQDSRLTTSDRMQDLLLESPGFPEFLLGLATISASLLSSDGAITCTITVEREGGPATVASSSEEGRRLDETQYAFDDGPCLTAARQQRLVLIADLRSDERWSDYLYQARAVTQEHTAQITKQGGDGRSLRRKNKMPYFFEVLEDLLGLRREPPPESTGPVASR